MSFQRKIMYSFGFLFAVSFGVFGLLFVRSYRQEKAVELNHMKEYNGQLSLSLDTMISSTNSLRYLHFSDDRIRNLLCTNDSDIDTWQHKQTEEKLRENLKLLVDMGQYTLRATVVTNDGRVYKNVEEESSDYISRIKEYTETESWRKEEKCRFTPVHKEIINLVGYEVISMASPIWDIMGEEPIAVMYLDLDFRKIENQWYQSADISRSFQFMVLSNEQLLFDSSDEKKLQHKEFETLKAAVENYWNTGKNEGILNIHDRRCVISITQNESAGWYLIQYMPAFRLTERILNSMWLFWLILAIALIFTAAVGCVVAKRVSRPISELSKVMGKVAHTVDGEQEIALFHENVHQGDDEIGQMIYSYNEMARRINDNIIKEYVYKLNQKQTELKMLQFQINPHFLYNALNTISSIAQLQEVDYIPEIASSLSEMFRYNISDKTSVTLREELDQTENYMSIQKIRFPERFVMEVDVEEELKSCIVLKFILQPIVENAYKYGFIKKRKQDILKIRAYRKGSEDVVIVVEDNGAGMSADKVSSLNKSFQNADGFGKTTGIGLSNVNARLKNYYGKKYGICVESCEGSFTRVYLRLKYISKEMR